MDDRERVFELIAGMNLAQLRLMVIFAEFIVEYRESIELATIKV